MSFIVKQLNPSHYESFSSLRAKHLELEPQSVGTTLKDHNDASKEQVVSLLLCQNTPPSDFVLGIFSQDLLVGMIGFKREFRKSSLHHKAIFWGFFVLPEYRKQGAGSMLVSSALDIIKDYKWCEMIRIMLSSEDLAVIHLAEKFGFESYGLEKKSRKIDGIYYDDYFYNKYFH